MILYNLYQYFIKEKMNPSISKGHATPVQVPPGILNIILDGGGGETFSQIWSGADLCPGRPLARQLYKQKHQEEPRAERREERRWKPPKQEKKVPKGQISGGAEQRGARAGQSWLHPGASEKPSAVSTVNTCKSEHDESPELCRLDSAALHICTILAVFAMSISNIYIGDHSSSPGPQSLDFWHINTKKRT